MTQVTNITTGRVLPDLSQDMDMAAELAKLRAENAKLKSNQVSGDGVRIKVSEKGAISVYGLGRFPVTLYKTQWLKLFTIIDKVRAFIDSNPSGMKHDKGDE